MGSSVGNNLKVVSAHSFDSFLLWFWEIIEDFSFKLGLNVTIEVSLGRKDVGGNSGWIGERK